MIAPPIQPAYADTAKGTNYNIIAPDTVSLYLLKDLLIPTIKYRANSDPLTHGTITLNDQSMDFFETRLGQFYLQFMENSKDTTDKNYFSLLFIGKREEKNSRMIAAKPPFTKASAGLIGLLELGTNTILESTETLGTYVLGGKSAKGVVTGSTLQGIYINDLQELEKLLKDAKK